jgi:hypothetical protein
LLAVRCTSWALVRTVVVIATLASQYTHSTARALSSGAARLLN